MAQEITGSDDVKHYLVESIASSPKWDRAISVTSNQGYETLLSEPDEFKSDPNPIRETSTKQQENYLKQDIKQKSNLMGVSVDVQANCLFNLLFFSMPWHWRNLTRMSV